MGKTIRVRDEFCRGGGGAEISCPNIILFPLLARKSSGFARILPDFLPENGDFKKSGGGGCSPMGRTPTPISFFKWIDIVVLL